MSPFWKNVNEELQYQGMNIKTLSQLTGIPYTTITNGKNRPDSIPSADVAIKIATVLNKSLERLLGEDGNIKSETNAIRDRNSYNFLLYKKYEQLILNLEKCSEKTQDSFFRLAQSICDN